MVGEVAYFAGDAVRYGLWNWGDTRMYLALADLCVALMLPVLLLRTLNQRLQAYLTGLMTGGVAFVVMLLYLDTSFARARAEGRMATRRDLYDAVHDGAVMRIRPKAMTVAAAFIGLLPLLWAQGTGADVMRRLAAPMIGGLFVSFVMELVVYPVIYFLAKQRQHRKSWTHEAPAREPAPTIENGDATQ